MRPDFHEGGGLYVKQHGDDDLMLRARLGALMHQAPVTFGVTLLIALGTMFTGFASGAGRGLAIWFGAVGLLAALRWMAATRFDAQHLTRVALWRRVSITGSAISGALWGSLPWLLWQAPGDLRLMLATIVGGMCAGTTAVNSAYFPAVFAFLTPAALPTIASFAARGTLQGMVAAVMASIFFIALSGASLRAHRMFGAHVRLQMKSARQQDALLETQTRLEAELLERQQAEARLQQGQKMQAIGQLAGGIAHDFNNVLQVIAGGAALLERHASDPAQVDRIARVIAQAAGRGAAVTRRLLAFSRRSDLHASSVDALSLLQGLREIFSHTLGAGITLAAEVSGNLAAFRADKAQLETVLINLAANARDAMGGSGCMTLAAAAHVQHAARDQEPGDLQQADLRPGHYVCLSVADDGAGMSAAVLAQATEPFFTTKPAGEGTGLGLAMARGFAEQSGGALRIASRPGEGTKVSLFFPVANGPADAEDAPVRFTARSATGRHSLLVVDDESLVRDIVAEELAAKGYAVHTAASGEAALQLLDEGVPVDLVISDLSMPGMDGLTFVNAAQLRRGRLPAILLTGFAGDAAELAIGGAVRGTFTLLRKPITVQALVDRIDTMLEAAAA